MKYKFKNELRAIGDVLRDQLFFLKGLALIVIHIREDRDAKDAIKGLNDFSNHIKVLLIILSQPEPGKIIKR